MNDDETTDDDKAKKATPDTEDKKTKEKEESEESKTVPLDDHVKLRKKKTAAEDKVAELEAKLAELEKPKEPAKKEDKTDDAAKKLEERLSKVEARDRNRALATDLGVSEDQAEAVATFLDKNPELEPEEALVILKKRDPKKFESEEPPTPSGQLRPKAGSRNTADDEPSWEDRLEAGRKLMKSDKRKGKQYANHLAGHFLAKAMGWEHKLTPIPKAKK